MDEIKFVDSSFNEVPLSSPKEQRFAIDLGVRCTFAQGWLSNKPLHFFVSAAPWVENVNKKASSDFLQDMERLNLGVTFELLTLEQIEKLNVMGRNADFEIRDCWTSSTYDDWHGRVDGYYSLKNGKRFIDWGQNLTDLYVAFGFAPQKEKRLEFPK